MPAVDQAKKMKGLVTNRVPARFGMLRPTPDEMDDLKPVAVIERSTGPALTRHDVAIQFDGYAVRLHAKDFHQRGECEGG